MEQLSLSELVKLYGDGYDPGVPADEDAYCQIMTLPLIHIFSVSVHTHTPTQVYGSIRATEVNGITFDIYDRDCTDPDTVSQEHGTLSLIGSHDNNPILGITGVNIDVCLKDRKNDIEFIKGDFFLDPTIEGIENSYDKLLKAYIHGNCGFACLYYTTFRFAVFATVEVTITEKRDKSSSFADVYGSVVVSYGNSRQYCVGDDESKYLDTVLFEKPSGRPVRAIVGTPIKLLRSVVVVPAYSSLIINANLSDAQVQLASGVLDFCVEGYGNYIKSIQSDNGCVKVKVAIQNAYPRIYEQRIFQRVVLSEDTRSKAEEPSKKAKAYTYQLIPPSLKPERSISQVAKQSNIEGCSMVEVFSVFVGGIHHEVSALCGTIKVDDGFIPFFIYERECSDPPDIVGNDKMVCVQVDRPIANSEFRIFVDLKDPILNLKVSKGIVGGSALHSSEISWFDKRICSILRGADGYAAIHYMIFGSALSAIVEVTFFCDNNCAGVTVTPNVYGVILGRYGGHEYSTDYDNKYYQSSLFKRPQNNAVQLKTKSRIPLSKSLVAVSVDSSLVVEANLRVIYNGSSHEEVVLGVAEFTVDMSRKICNKIGGGSCYIDVSVEFRTPY